MRDLIPSLQKYFTLRGALLSYQRLPWALEEAQAAQLQAAVAKEIALTQRALDTAGEAHQQPSAAIIGESLESFIGQLQQYGSPTALLQQAGLDSEQLREAITQEVIVAEVLEQVMMEATPSEEELRAIFEQNRERFVAPERREVFQILMTVNDRYPENQREVARQRMDELARKARAAPGTFGDLALSHSECPSAVDAGRLGLVPAGHLYPDLDRELFALESGAISNVVESPLGFHLLRCGVIEPLRQLDWHEVRESLTRRLTELRRKRTLQQWLAGTAR